MERAYGGHLCYSQPIEQGFYYDMHEYSVKEDEDYKVLDDLVKNIVKEKQPLN